VKGIDDLRGRSVNLGPKSGGERRVALRLSQFAGYAENVDFVETNWTAEELLALPESRMPDAIFTISSAPSYLVEMLVRRSRYKVVEIPFPQSLALRYGWAANGEIVAYTYALNPPAPEKTITTVAVNMHLVANAATDPLAIEKLLEILYGPDVAARLRQPLDEKRITVASGFPLSRGLTAFLDRNSSVFTVEAWNKLTSSAGLAMSFLGMILVVLKWFRGPKTAAKTDDDEFHGYMAEVATIERRISGLGAKAELGELDRMRARVEMLRHVLLERYRSATLTDPHLFDRCLSTVRAAYDRIDRMMARSLA
jgi:hypothetical protein